MSLGRLRTRQVDAANPGGAASSTEALGQHADNGLLDEGVNLAQVDTAQGDQIVGHVFGDKRGDVVNHLGGLGGSGGIGAGAIQKLLPILAPIAMAWVAKKVAAGVQPPAQAGPRAASATSRAASSAVQSVAPLLPAPDPAALAASSAACSAEDVAEHRRPSWPSTRTGP